MKLVFPDEVGRGHVTKVVLDDGDEMVSLAGLEVSVLTVQLNSKGIFYAENRGKLIHPIQSQSKAN